MIEQLPEDLKRELGRYEHKMYFSQVLEELQRKTHDIYYQLTTQTEFSREEVATHWKIFHDVFYNGITEFTYVYPVWVLEPYMSYQTYHSNAVVTRKTLRTSLFRTGIWTWTKGDVTKEMIP
jgi:hypothetical protein